MCNSRWAIGNRFRRTGSQGITRSLVAESITKQSEAIGKQSGTRMDAPGQALGSSVARDRYSDTYSASCWRTEKAPRLDEIRPWWPKRAIRDTYGRPRSIPRFQRCTRSVLGHVFGVVLALWKAPRLDEIRPWWPKQAFALVALVPERAVTSVA